MTAKEMLGKVDHTQLKAFATWEDIQKLCDEAIQYHTASGYENGTGERLPKEVEAYRQPIDYEELIGDMNLNKLHEIFRSIVKKQEDKIDPVRSQYGNIEKDEVDMDIKMLYVEAYAREHKTFSFRKLLEKQNSKMEVIVTFLIILELMKTGKINISQENIFDDIMITSNV